MQSYSSVPGPINLWGSAPGRRPRHDVENGLCESEVSSEYRQAWWEQGIRPLVRRGMAKGVFIPQIDIPIRLVDFGGTSITSARFLVPSLQLAGVHPAGSQSVPGVSPEVPGGSLGASGVSPEAPWGALGTLPGRSEPVDGASLGHVELP